MVEEIRSPWNFKIVLICWNFLTLAFNLFSSTADHCVTLINESDESVAAVRQCYSPREKSLSSRIHEDQFTSPCPCPWTTKSLKIFKDYAFCKLSVMYDHVTSKNSVTATVCMRIR